MRVQVSRVDLDSRKIDFRMVREGDDERLLSRAATSRVAFAAGDELAAVRDADRAAKASMARAAKARPRVSSKQASARAAAAAAGAAPR